MFWRPPSPTKLDAHSRRVLRRGGPSITTSHRASDRVQINSPGMLAAQAGGSRRERKRGRRRCTTQSLGVFLVVTRLGMHGSRGAELLRLGVQCTPSLSPPRHFLPGNCWLCGRLLCVLVVHLALSRSLPPSPFLRPKCARGKGLDHVANAATEYFCGSETAALAPIETAALGWGCSGWAWSRGREEAGHG